MFVAWAAGFIHELGRLRTSRCCLNRFHLLRRPRIRAVGLRTGRGNLILIIAIDTRSTPVHSLLDYGNAVLVGIPTYLVRRLQSVLNAAAARLIVHLRPHDHITETLATLHWLRVPERVQYKIAVLT